MIEKIFNDFNEFKEFIKLIYDDNFETYKIILNNNSSSYYDKIENLNIKFKGTLILNYNNLQYISGNFDIDELYINIKSNYLYLNLNTTIKKLVCYNHLEDDFMKYLDLSGNYLNLIKLDVNNINYLKLEKNFNYNNNFELYNNKNINNLWLSNPIKFTNNLIDNITIDNENFELNIKSNNIKSITLTEKCKNIIIKGEFKDLNKIICMGDLNYLELNGTFKKKVIIKNKHINQIKYNGNFYSIIHPIDNCIINTSIYENFKYNDNDTKNCYIKNIIFLNNVDINYLIIKENCNLSGNFENVKKIIIKNDCKKIILKGNFSNLDEIICEVDLDYLEFNEIILKKELIIDNKNINQFKFFNINEVEKILYNIHLIKERIYDNTIFKSLNVYSDITLLNNKNICEINYYKGNINGDINNIIRLIINEENETNNIPDNLINLRELEINNCDIKEIPYTFINLEKLKLNNCKNIFNIPNTFIKLKELEINNCDNIKEISNTFINLEKLKLNNCKNIFNIPNTFIKLKELEINNCDNIKEIPYTFINLEKLKLNNCKNISYIFNNFINLKELELKNCDNIKEIPYTFIKLEKLEINNCNNIIKIPRTLINLISLIINNNNLIKDIPKTLNKIQHLEYDYLNYYKQNIQNKINDINDFFKLKNIFNIL